MIQVEHMVIPRSWEVCVWKGDELVLRVSVWVGLSWAVPLILPGTAPASQTSCSPGCWLLAACYPHGLSSSPRFTQASSLIPRGQKWKLPGIHHMLSSKASHCRPTLQDRTRRVEKAAKEAAISNLPQILKVISKRGTKRI